MGMGGAKYSMFRMRGKDVCALYPMADEQKKMKVPPFWLPYIAVKSADETAKKAKAAGGKILMEPKDVMDEGRMAIIQDPGGACCAIWQARKHRGAALTEAPGSVCWHDLSTPKTEVAGRFYMKVFGWKLIDKDFSGNKYHQFQLGKKNVCGMWPMPMRSLPPCWVTHWRVADCAKTVAKAKRLGGRALMETTTVPNISRFAILTDPAGAGFGIVEPIGALKKSFSSKLS